jgi:hypothetical protein
LRKPPQSAVLTCLYENSELLLRRALALDHGVAGENHHTNRDKFGDRLTHEAPPVTL